MMRELGLHNCRAVVVFEGGYHLQASAACAEAVIRQLMPSPPLASAAESTQPPPSLPSEDDSAAAVAAANADADADTDADTDAGADAVAQERERCRRLDAACVGSLGELTEPTLRLSRCRRRSGRASARRSTASLSTTTLWLAPPPHAAAPSGAGGTAPDAPAGQARGHSTVASGRRWRRQWQRWWWRRGAAELRAAPAAGARRLATV